MNMHLLRYTTTADRPVDAKICPIEHVRRLFVAASASERRSLLMGK